MTSKHEVHDECTVLSFVLGIEDVTFEALRMSEDCTFENESSSSCYDIKAE